MTIENDKITRAQIIANLLQACVVSIPILGVVFWYAQQITTLAVNQTQIQESIRNLHARMDKEESNNHAFEVTMATKLGEISSSAAGMAANLDAMKKVYSR